MAKVRPQHQLFTRPNIDPYEILDSGLRWHLVPLNTLQHQDRQSSSAASRSADVTALAFGPRSLYVGDTLGRVWLWNPPGTELSLNDNVNGGLCMACHAKFGLMESELGAKMEAS